MDSISISLVRRIENLDLKKYFKLDVTESKDRHIVRISGKMIKKNLLQIDVYSSSLNIFRIGFVKGHDYKPKDFNFEKFDKIVKMYLEVLEGRALISSLESLS